MECVLTRDQFARLARVSESCARTPSRMKLEVGVADKIYHFVLGEVLAGRLPDDCNREDIEVVLNWPIITYTDRLYVYGNFSPGQREDFITETYADYRSRVESRPRWSA